MERLAEMLVGHEWNVVSKQDDRYGAPTDQQGAYRLPAPMSQGVLVEVQEGQYQTDQAGFIVAEQTKSP